MMLHAEAGNVIECMRKHYVFTQGGTLVALASDELLILIEVEHFLAKAIRVETSEIVYVSLLDSPTFTDSFVVDEMASVMYRQVWP